MMKNVILVITTIVINLPQKKIEFYRIHQCKKFEPLYSLFFSFFTVSKLHCKAFNMKVI